jgi:hypothetical protein
MKSDGISYGISYGISSEYPMEYPMESHDMSYESYEYPTWNLMKYLMKSHGISISCEILWHILWDILYILRNPIEYHDKSYGISRGLLWIIF